MNFRNIYLFLLIILFASSGCGNKPVFTEMSTNRLKIVLKGTLESEGSSYSAPFETASSIPYIANSQTTATAIEDSTNSNDSVDDVKNPAEDYSPSVLMLDIAEIRIGGLKNSNYRQVLEIPLDASHPFFNGQGIELKTDDPGFGYYDTVEIFFRKICFDNAKIYTASGGGFVFEKNAEVIFHENDRFGLDINQLMVNSYWDSLRLEQGEIIRVFPMYVPIIGGLAYNNDSNETVLEIRLVIKNYIKKFELDYYEDGLYKVCHYYAPSDWLRDVRTGESDIGRNLIASARAYVPGYTAASVTVGAAAGSYIIAIPSSEQISDYYLAKSGRLIRNDVAGDFPMPPSYPGAYVDPLLDYYLKIEKYKLDWNNVLTTLTAASPSGLDLFSKYQYHWDMYENNVKGGFWGFKIPPYVAYCTSGSTVTFGNMAPGSYNFYQITAPITYGSLFVEADFDGGTPTPINGATPVLVGSGTTITIP